MKSPEKSASDEAQPDLLSDRGYVQACINLANNPCDFDDDLVESEFEPAPDAGLINCFLTIMRFDDPGLTLTIHEAFARLHRRAAKELREILRTALMDACKSTSAARKRYRSRVDVMLDGVAVDTELHLRDDWRLGHRHRYKPQDHEAALALLWVFLLDPDRPFYSELRRCQLSTCQKFFLAEKNPAGGPRRKYCTTDCAYSADKIKAARERAPRSRKRRNR